jgi:hypothetical protein
MLRATSQLLTPSACLTTMSVCTYYIVYFQAADDGTEVATAHDKLAQARAAAAAAAAAAKQTYSNSGKDTCTALTTKAIYIAL